MLPVAKPNKQKVREYMGRRTQEESPPPSLEEIRRQMGWYLAPNNGPVPEVSE